MDDNTLERLKELRDEREDAKRGYERAAKRFRDALAGTDLPVTRLASELGVSRQAIYQLMPIKEER